MLCHHQIIVISSVQKKEYIGDILIYCRSPAQSKRYPAILSYQSSPRGETNIEKGIIRHHCKSNSVESEEHFLLRCSLFKEECIQSFTPILNCKPELLEGDVEKVFISIMSSDNERVLISLAKFIQTFMEKIERTISMLTFFRNVFLLYV